jgi:hypothetical protein
MGVIAEARVRLADGTEAIFVAKGEETEPGIIAGASTLAFPVASFEDAMDIIDTINRSRRRKAAAAATPPAEAAEAEKVANG